MLVKRENMLLHVSVVGRHLVLVIEMVARYNFFFFFFFLRRKNFEPVHVSLLIRLVIFVIAFQIHLAMDVFFFCDAVVPTVSALCSFVSAHSSVGFRNCVVRHFDTYY